MHLCRLKKLVFSTIFFLIFGSVDAQVSKVKFVIKYDTTTCMYDVCFVVTEGQTTMLNHQFAGNSAIGLVIPTGTTLSVDTSYAPFSRVNPTIIADWGLGGNPIIGGCSAPEFDFYHVTPNLPLQAIYNPLNVGDTVKLFRVKVDNNLKCETALRLFRNSFIQSSLVCSWSFGSTTCDPPATAPCMEGRNFENGFTVGGGSQLYVGNINPKLPPQPKLDGGGPVCEIPGALSIKLDPDTTNCQDAFTFQWSGPQGSLGQNQNLFIPSGAPSGTYSVTVTDPIGCKDTFEYLASPKPSAGSDQTACGGQSITLVGTPAGGYWTSGSNPSGDSFSSSGSNATVAFSTAAVGDFTYIYVNGECTDTAKISVTSGFAAPQLTKNGNVCAGGNLTLTTPAVSGATYTWYFNNNPLATTTLPTYTINNASNANTGTYSLQISKDGCNSARSDLPVTINSLPIVSASNSGPYCPSETIQLNSNGGSNYMWAGPGLPSGSMLQNPTISNASTSNVGDYRVTVTDVNGCSNTAITNVALRPAITVSASSDKSSYCEGESVILTGSGGVSYTWLGQGGLNAFGGNTTINNIQTNQAGIITLTVVDANGCSGTANVNISVNPSPSPTASNNGPVCEGKTLILTASGGTNYQWSGPSLSQAGASVNINNVNTSQSGIYTVVVTNNSGCSNAATTNVTINSLPNPSIIGDLTYCVNQTILLSATGGTNYSWTGPPSFIDNDANVNRPNATPAMAGLYNVVVTDANGCSATASADVTIDPLPIPEITGDLIYCVGDEISLTASGGDIYNWTGPGSYTDNDANVTRPNATAAMSGIYQVRVTDAQGCSATTNVTVVVNALPIPSISGDSVYCIGETLTLIATGGISFQWSGPNATTNSGGTWSIPSVDNTTAGTYTVVVTDGNGCTSSKSKNVVINPLPTATISGVSTYCAGETISLKATGGSLYAWTGPGAYTSTISDVVRTNATSAMSGNYQVVVTDANGCSSSANIDIIINDKPIGAATSNKPEYCVGEEIQLIATGGTSYLWAGPGSMSNNTSNPTLSNATIAMSGKYKVTITNNNGCQDIDSVTILVNPIPTVTATNGGPFCANGTITLNATGPAGAQYVWSGPNLFNGNIFNPTISPATAASNGIYTVEITDTKGCKNSATTNVSVRDLPVALASNGSPACEGQSITLTASGGTSYLWSGPQLYSANTANPLVNDLTQAKAGIYTVVVSDANNCTATATTEVIVNNKPIATATSDSPICEGGVINLQANGGVTYLWTGPAAFNSILDKPIIANATLAKAGIYNVVVTDANNCSATASTVVNINPKPIVSATSNSPLCVGQDLTFTASGGVTYEWTGPGFSGTNTNNNPVVSQVTTSASGIYTVQVSDINGCKASATVNVVVNNGPIITVDKLGFPYCIGDQIRLTASGGNTYLWSGPDNFTSIEKDPIINNATVAKSGSYKVIGINNAGCKDSTSIDISVNPLPSPFATNLGPYCEGENLNLSAIGGTTYVWTGPASYTATGSDPVRNNLAVSMGGTYTVAVTDANGCDATANTVVVVATNPVASIFSDKATYCKGETATLVASGGTNYTWAGGLGVNPTLTLPSVQTTQIYSVTVSNAAGCESMASISVIVNDRPTLTVNKNKPTYCEGDNVILNASGANNYIWSGPNSVSANTSTVAINNVTAAANGWYKVTATNTDGCIAIDSILLDINLNPNATASNDGPYCVDQTINLSATGPVGARYEWSRTGGAFSSVDQNPVRTSASTGMSGVYSVIVTSAAGCVATQSTTVVVNPKPAAVIDDSFGPYCAGDTIVLNAIGGSMYDWTGPSFSSAFDKNNITSATLANSGTYTVIVTDINNCSNTASILVVVNANPIASASNTGPYCEGQIIQLTATGGDTYSWTGPDAFIASSSQPTLSDVDRSNSGIYTVVVSVSNGCSSSASTNVEVNDNPTLTITNVSCSADLLTYTVTFVSNGTITSSGNIVGNTITGIPSGVDITITATSAAGNCSVVESVSAPDCNCPDVPKPIIVGSDKEVCFGLSNPSLEVEVTNGNVVDWYNLATGGTPLVSNSKVYTPTNNTKGEFCYFAEARNPVDDCVSSTRTRVCLTIKDIPSITNPSQIELCPDVPFVGFVINTDLANTAVTWTATSTNVSGLNTSGSGNIPAIALTLQNIQNPGSVVYTATPNLDGCIGNPVQYRLDINPLPSFVITKKQCASNLTTYDIEYSAVGTVTTTDGTHDALAKKITNIPAGRDIVITITSDKSCVTTVNVTAPICNCSAVDAPVAGSNKSICLGGTLPSLSATAPTGAVIDWYETASGGAAIVSSSTTFTPIGVSLAGTYTYYAESRNIVDQCVSDTRTPVTLTIHPEPTITIIKKECSSDLTTYDIEFVASGTVSVTPIGVVTGSRITNISSGTTVSITVTDATNCSNTIVVSAPVCNCDPISPPIKNNDYTRCFDANNPALSVAVAGNGLVVDWYDVATGGAALASNTLTYTPTIALTGTYTFYAEARNPVDNCVSSTRTAVVLTIYPEPTFTTANKICSADLLTYSFTFATSGSVIASTGVVTGTSISGIPSGSPVNVTVTDATNCVKNFVVAALTCNCTPVAAPGKVADVSICQFETNPALSVTVGNGIVVDWYDMPTNGVALGSGTSFVPTINTAGVHTFYAEARNTTDNCVSDVRTPVSLTINAKPNAGQDQTVACFSTDQATLTAIGATNWTIGPSAGTALIVTPAGASTVVTNFSVEGVYSFICTSNSGCKDTVIITVGKNCNCAISSNNITAPNVLTYCETAPSTVIVGSTPNPTGGTYSWIYKKDGVFTNLTQNTTQKDLTTGTLGAGTHTFSRAYTINTGIVCTDTTNEVSIVVSQPISAGPDQVNNCVDIQTLIVKAAATGTGSWMQANGNPSIVIISNISAPNASISGFTSPGLYTFTWSNGVCTDQFIIAVSPKADAGPNPAPVDCYEGSIVELKAGDNSGQWIAMNSNPSTVTISSPNNASTDVFGFAKSGLYRFIWTSNACADTVTVTIGDNCPCDIAENLIVPPFDSVYCETTGEILLIGSQAIPVGGTYKWVVSKDGNPYQELPGVFNEIDYIIRGFGPGEYRFARIYSIVVPNVCSDTSNTVYLKVNSNRENPGVIIIEPYPVCVGDSLELAIDPKVGYTYNWSILSGQGRIILASQSKIMIYAEAAGTMKVSVTQVSEDCGGMVSSPSVVEFMINNNPRPYLGVDTTYCSLEEVRQLDAGNYESYLWDDGSMNRYRNIDEKGTYSVEVMDSLGCSGQDFITIKEFCCKFIFPNVIDVNDNVNSKFSLKDIYSCAIKSELYIYDRWGNLVFKSMEGIDAYWDGTYNGRLVEQGVYAFIFKYTGLDENEQEFEENIAGDITVLR